MANGGEAGSGAAGPGGPGLAETAAQSIHQPGNRNIAAQASGGSTITQTIHLGLSGLEIVSGRRSLAPGLPDSALLRSDYAIVPFHPARLPAVEELLAWCASDAQRALRLIHERGGAGKTRLLVEVTERLRADGWIAGFLKPPPLDEKPPEASYESLFPAAKPVLIVLDYAESRRAELVPLLRTFRAKEGEKARIVLLARTAGEWWDALPGSDADVQEVMGGWADVRALPALDDQPALRAEIFASARIALAAQLGVAASAGPDGTVPEFSTFLFLHLAALAAIRGHPVGSADQLLRWVLDRERQAWKRGLRDAGLPERLEAVVAQTVALATLAHAVPDDVALLRLVDRAPLAAGTDATTRDRIRAVVARLYPDSTQLGALRPDVLGEELVAAEILSSGMADAAFAADVPPDSLRSGLTVLTRHARRRGKTELLETALGGRLDHLAAPAMAVALEAGDPLGKVLATMIDKGPIERPDLLEPLLPEQTLVLREAGAAIMLQMSERLPSVDRAAEPELIERARVANNLGNRLSELGRREEALAAAEEAVRIRRTLARDRPDAFLPDLAMSLNNLGNRLSDLGRREEALAAAEEAVGVYRTLARDRPDAFLPDLASSLSNLGNMLSALGRREEALAAAEEAVRIRRTLARDRPDAFTPYLAASIDNLGSRLSALGRLEDALRATTEGVKIRRELASDRPDAFQPDLARSLTNLGTMLSGLGRREEALAAAEEAVRVYRTLARDRPEAFLPDVARSLNNLGGILSYLGRRDEALAATEEAVAIRRTLTRDRPDVFLPYLAGSLTNLGTMLSGLGRREEALAAAEEAVRVYRTLARDRPDAFLPDFALSLNNLGALLSDLGRREEALAAAEEAVRIRRTLARDRPDAFLPYLASSLHSLSNRLSELGRREEALLTAEEAVQILRESFMRLPAAHASWMGAMVRNYLEQFAESAIEPDMELLGPIAMKLLELQQSKPAGGN